MRVFYIVVGKSISDYGDYIHKSGYLNQKNSTFVNSSSRGLGLIIKGLKDNLKSSKEFTDINLIYIDGNKETQSQ